MPEALLRLFPDVGALYFLSRLPGYFGNVLAIIILVCHLIAFHRTEINLSYFDLIMSI